MMGSDPPPQFDTSDLGSPKKVWSLLCDKEEKYTRDPHLFQRQRKINPKMRSMLLDWLMDVCADKHMHRETFHLCIDYLDRYLGKYDENQVLPQRLQLIGSTALFIASKIEEIYPPRIAEIAEYTDGVCTEQDIRDLEVQMLQHLDWQFYPFTSVHWLALYMQLMSTNDILRAQHVTVTAARRPPHEQTPNRELCSPSDLFHHQAAEGPPSLNVSIVLDDEEDKEEEDAADSEVLAQSVEGQQTPVLMKEVTVDENHKPGSSGRVCFGGTGKRLLSSSSAATHKPKHVFTFNSSFPRMQLSQIGSSPRLLLRTAAADISYVGHRSYSSGHIYPDQRCTVPKLMRGEFVRMSMILDLIALDTQSLRFRYSELATAVLLCSYEPEALICQLTGFKAEKLREVRDFVDPFVQLFDRLEPTGTQIPCVPGVQHDDRHNIQTYINNCLTHLESLENMRKELEQRRKALDMRVAAAAASQTTRKRKFGSTAPTNVGISHEI